MKSKFIAGAAVFLLASTSAMAGAPKTPPPSSTSPAVIPDSSASTTAYSLGIAKGMFSESFTFTTASDYNGKGSLYAFSGDTNFDKLSIASVNTNDTRLLSSYNGIPAAGNVTATFWDSNYVWNLAAGQTYTVIVTGDSLANGSKFQINATQGFISNTVGPVTPVPEPESYAMFLAGLGLMGAIAKRRKSKQA